MRIWDVAKLKLQTDQEVLTVDQLQSLIDSKETFTVMGITCCFKVCWNDTTLQLEGFTPSPESFNFLVTLARYVPIELVKDAMLSNAK